MAIDEGPSAEDIDRFDSDTGYCPSCGAEVWDQAVYCPSCHEPIEGAVSSRPPVEDFLRRRWFLLVAIIVLIAFMLVFVL